MANNKSLQQAWFAAVAAGDNETLLSLVQQGLSIDTCDDKKNTALHHAVKKNHPEMMRFLIEHGADVNAINDWQSTPLHLTEKNVAMIQILLEAGANPNLKDKDWDYPYYFAFYGSMTEELTKLYIKYGAHIKFVEKE